MSNLEDMEFDLIWEGKKYKGVWNQSIKAFALRPVSPPAQKRCIIMLSTRNDDSNYLFASRIHTMRRVITEKFPSVPNNWTFPQMLMTEDSSYKEHVFTILDAQPGHFAWARQAKECGFIDSVIEDYDPNQSYEE